MTAAKTDYASLSHELETIVATLQEGDVSIDEALKAYERGTELVGLLEKQLKTAENRITELRAKLQD